MCIWSPRVHRRDQPLVPMRGACLCQHLACLRNHTCQRSNQRQSANVGEELVSRARAVVAVFDLRFGALLVVVTRVGQQQQQQVGLGGGHPRPVGRAPYPARWLTVASQAGLWPATSAMTSLPGSSPKNLLFCPTFISGHMQTAGFFKK